MRKPETHCEISNAKLQKKAIRKAIIDYYDTINMGKITIPSFILAEIAMWRTKAFSRLEPLYSKLVNG